MSRSTLVLQTGAHTHVTVQAALLRLMDGVSALCAASARAELGGGGRGAAASCRDAGTAAAMRRYAHVRRTSARCDAEASASE